MSCEASARQRIYTKHQALFYSEDRSKKIKCRLLQILYGALMVKAPTTTAADNNHEYFFMFFRENKTLL